MSEYTENENVMDEALEAAEETVEETEEIVEAEEAADEETEQAEEVVAEEQDRDAILFDKAQRAARLLRNRRDAISKEADTKAERMSDMVRALKLLELKPKMEQKEMADLLGMSLRALDELMAKAEAEDLVGRIESEEDDKRKVVVFAAEGAVEAAANAKPEKDHYVPSLSDEKIDEICAMLDEIINPLTEMGLDNDRRDGRGGFGGRDDRRGGDRGGFRGGDRGGRGGFGGRGGDRGGRGGFGGRDDRRGGDRGGRSFGDRDSRGGDRGGRGGFGGRDDRRGGDRGGRSFGDRGGYGNRGGYGDRGGRGGYGGRDSRGGDRSGRGGYGSRGGYGNRGGYNRD